MSTTRTSVAVRVLAFAGACLVSVSAAWAFDASGTVTGVVRDPSGAVVVGADVALLSAQQTNVRSTRTGPDGRFSLDKVSAGRYVLLVSFAGFADRRYGRVRDFAERVLAPRAVARDVSGEFPAAELRELGRLGLLGIAVPEELGGAAAGPIAYSLAMQELARADASVAVAESVTNMVGELIANNGSPALAGAWVPRLASGELVCGAFALSEPEAGSDPAAIRTTAVRTADGWRLSGTKQ